MPLISALKQSEIDSRIVIESATIRELKNKLLTINAHIQALEGRGYRHSRSDRIVGNIAYKQLTRLFVEKSQITDIIKAREAALEGPERAFALLAEAIVTKMGPIIVKHIQSYQQEDLRALKIILRTIQPMFHTNIDALQLGSDTLAQKLHGILILLKNEPDNSVNFPQYLQLREAFLGFSQQLLTHHRLASSPPAALFQSNWHTLRTTIYDIDRSHGITIKQLYLDAAKEAVSMLPREYDGLNAMMDNVVCHYL